MTLARSAKGKTPNVEERYKALLRSLQRTKGFGIVFVQCTPDEATRLFSKLKQDLPQKFIDVLKLSEPIDNLYEIIAARPDRDELNILFVRGIEKSLEPYIQQGLWRGGDYYKLDTVPRILSHLNQQRENFRDHFSNICFVFIVPLFALKYFIQRAPDFFDWRSGVYVFPSETEAPDQEAPNVIEEKYGETLKLALQQHDYELLKIQELLKEKHQNPEHKAQLFLKQGNLFMLLEDSDSAIACFNKTLELEPNNYEAWYNRGIALCTLDRDDEAIASFNKALEFKPNDHEIWYSRGKALRRLERYEEAIASYDNALKLKPDYYEAWYGRGRAFRWLERYEEAIASYDNALKLKPDYCKAWYSRGRSLKRLEHYKEAVDSFNKALKLEPDNYLAWYNKGNVLVLMKRYEEAIASYEKALEIRPDMPDVWNNRGNALATLGCYEKAIESFNKSLEYSPDNAMAFYNKACCCTVWGKFEEAIENLQFSINLNSNKYRELAKIDSDFDDIRDDERFQAVINES